MSPLEINTVTGTFSITYFQEQQGTAVAPTSSVSQENIRLHPQGRAVTMAPLHTMHCHPSSVALEVAPQSAPEEQSSRTKL